ncbi:MAG TPA: polymer-forming cytoskeletal protein, partial [Gemmatimonadales bacterium]|nr:polymer-forming cytoskeletal protein [Gemmatimonadales bacterium]
MRTSSRLLLLLALLSAVGQRPVGAETRPRSSAADLVDQFWTLITDASSRLHSQRQPPRVRPQAIPQGGTPIDLSDLSRPTIVEAQLRSALGRDNGTRRLTVAGGSARQGDFSLGSSEDLKGNLLVVDGDADVYGSLRGNLVTVDGDVVVHPGGVVSGDVLTLGGEVRDEGGEIGGEVRTLQSAPRQAPVAGEAATTLSPFESVLRRGAGVLGVFLTLGALGFGLVMFGRQNLEVVSDTVSHSF